MSKELDSSFRVNRDHQSNRRYQRETCLNDRDRFDERRYESRYKRSDSCDRNPRARSISPKNNRSQYRDFPSRSSGDNYRDRSRERYVDRYDDRSRRRRSPERGFDRDRRRSKSYERRRSPVGRSRRSRSRSRSPRYERRRSPIRRAGGGFKFDSPPRVDAGRDRTNQVGPSVISSLPSFSSGNLGSSSCYQTKVSSIPNSMSSSSSSMKSVHSQLMMEMDGHVGSNFIPASVRCHVLLATAASATLPGDKASSALLSMASRFDESIVTANLTETELREASRLRRDMLREVVLTNLPSQSTPVSILKSINEALAAQMHSRARTPVRLLKESNSTGYSLYKSDFGPAEEGEVEVPINYAEEDAIFARTFGSSRDSRGSQPVSAVWMPSRDGANFAILLVRSLEESSFLIAQSVVTLPGSAVSHAVMSRPSALSSLQMSEAESLNAIKRRAGSRELESHTSRLCLYGLPSLPHGTPDSAIKDMLSVFGPLTTFFMLQRKTPDVAAPLIRGCVVLLEYKSKVSEDSALKEIHGDVSLGMCSKSTKLSSEIDVTLIKPGFMRLIPASDKKIETVVKVLLANLGDGKGSQQSTAATLAESTNEGITMNKIKNLMGSRCICLENLGSKEEWLDDSSYAEIVADVRVELARFGDVEGFAAPRPLAQAGTDCIGMCKVFATFVDKQGALQARRALDGRQFGKRTVHAFYVKEDMLPEIFKEVEQTIAEVCQAEVAAKDEL